MRLISSLSSNLRELAAPLRQPIFRTLFIAQTISLIGTGLATIALALLAYQLNPTKVGMVLSLGLAIKMVAYVLTAPLMSALVGVLLNRISIKTWLLILNVLRGLVILLMLFASQTWQFYLYIFLLSVLAAGYTPIYQALLPSLFSSQEDYTKALSLSRLASELETLLSPGLAALLLLFASYALLFAINALGFFIAALLLMITVIPQVKHSERLAGGWHKISFGISSYLKTPRLRATLAINLVMSCAGAMVIVNSVVIVKRVFMLSDVYIPMLSLAAGVGAMLIVVFVPALSKRYNDRQLMLASAVVIIMALFLAGFVSTFWGFFPIWLAIGGASTVVLVATGNVLKYSSAQTDRNDYFSANFSLTHGMWLVTYLLAGWGVQNLGLTATFWLLAGLALIASFYAKNIWQPIEDSELYHEHSATEHSHFHSHNEHHQHEHEGWEGPEPHRHPHYHGTIKHRHHFVIDEHHLQWPK